MATQSSVLARESQGLGSLVGGIYGVAQSRTRLKRLSSSSSRVIIGSEMVKNLPAMWETWVQSLVWEDPLEEGMASHSSILAWRILWTEEPGGLQSLGLQRVRHSWVTKNTHNLWREKPTSRVTFSLSMCVCSVAQSYSTCFERMDCVAHQAPLSMGWVAVSFSRGSSNPGIEPASSVSPATAGRFFITEPPGKPFL